MRDRLASAALRFVRWRDRAQPRGDAGPARWRGEIERAALHGRLLVLEGWALHSSGAPDHVEVRWAERELGRARLGLPRPIVALKDRHAEAAVSGYELLSSIDAPPEAVLTVIATAPDGSRKAWRCPVARHAADHEEAPPAPTAPDPRGAPRPPIGQPLRVLVVTHDLGPGGAQFYLRDLLAGLRRRTGWRVHVVAPRDGCTRGDLESAGVHVTVFGDYPFADLGEYDRAARRLGALVAAEQPDLLLANTMGAFLGVDVAAACGVPSAWAIHESFAPDVFWRVAFGSGLHPRVRSRGERALAAATKAVFVAASTRALYAPAVGPERAVVLRYGVEVPPAEVRPDPAARARLGIAPERVVLLCMATIEPRKAQVLLVRAFARLAARHPQADLVLVGDRPRLYSEAVHLLIARLGLEGRVRVVPLTPEVDTWFRGADVLVNASDVESLPRCILEALAHRLFVVSTSVFGVPELLTDLDAACLVRENDVSALGAGLERALALDPGTRQALAARAAPALDALPAGADLDGWQALLESIAHGPSSVA
ncbi:MAG: glycosyltransferase family 4 protein [Vicinamibacteria bacterium]|nr:glycosyltransferase family 4 protein [Vicinamibacteria bacterium]